MPRTWIRLKDSPKTEFIDGAYYGFEGRFLGVEAFLKCNNAKTGSFTVYCSPIRDVEGLTPGSQFYLYRGKLTDPKKIEESFKKHLTSATKHDTLSK